MYRNKYLIRPLITAVLMFFIGTGTLYSQDLQADLECMDLNYRSMDNFRTELRMELYGRNAQQPQMVESGRIQKRGAAFFYDFGDLKLLYNAQHILVLNLRERQAILGPRNIDPELEALLIREMPSADSMLQMCDSTAFLGIEKGIKAYALYSSGSPVVRTELWVNEGTGLIEKMTYHYNESLYPEYSHAVLIFADTDLQPRFARNTFSEKRFLRSTSSGFRLKAPYEDFELIHNAQN